MSFFRPPNVVELKAKRDVEGLIKALGYELDSGAYNHTWIRRLAAEALGLIGGRRAVEPLIAAIRDKDDGVRKAADKALSMIGWQPGMDELAAAYWIAKGQVARCAAIGAPAVEPLIAALRDKNGWTRRDAAEALGQIGDRRAVEPLIAALRDKSGDVHRPDAARALGEIGDLRALEPLIAALGDWKVGNYPEELCREVAGALGRIGDKRAVEPILVDLREFELQAYNQYDYNRYCGLVTSRREIAARTLHLLGWQPGEDADGAAYWIAKGEWDRCVEIGSAAVEPLIAALRYRHRSERKDAAEALVKIYRSGSLDDRARRQIFAVRAEISRPHDDHLKPSSSDCTWSHHDEGIGVAF